MKKKLIVLIMIVFLLSGCTKTLKDDNKKVVKNPETGQSITENIICKPTNEETIKIYEENNIDISKLPTCKGLNVFESIEGNEGLWTNIFIKPLAWLIINVGILFNNYGIAIILVTLLIRLAAAPITKKTAMQSENMKKAKPELDKLEKKYKDKTSQEDQMKKSQEMMMIYKKQGINPISGCLLAVLQLPLFFAFLEAINRVPAIFENKFLIFHMGMTPLKGIKNGNYWYILLIIIVLGSTFLSFRKTLADQSGAQAGTMKYTIYIMLGIISISIFSLPTALAIYWSISSIFTVVQNMLVERKKARSK